MGPTSTWTSPSPAAKLALLDEDEFHEHARTMAYPDDVVRGAWSGIADGIAANYYTNSDWPFDGKMQEWGWTARSRGWS